MCVWCAVVYIIFRVVSVALCVFVFVLTLLAESALVVEIAALADRAAVGADANSTMLAGVVVLARVARVAPHALQQRAAAITDCSRTQFNRVRARFNLARTLA
jgi:hypothetical protein